MEGYVRSIYDYVENMAESLDEVVNAVDKHAERIAKLENWRANVNGRLTLTVGLGGAIVGAAASQIARLFGGP